MGKRVNKQKQRRSMSSLRVCFLCFSGREATNRGNDPTKVHLGEPEMGYKSMGNWVSDTEKSPLPTPALVTIYENCADRFPGHFTFHLVHILALWGCDPRKNNIQLGRGRKGIASVSGEL